MSPPCNGGRWEHGCKVAEFLLVRMTILGCSPTDFRGGKMLRRCIFRAALGGWTIKNHATARHLNPVHQ